MVQEQNDDALFEFIEDNHKLLTVIGVFGGLTALFTGITYGEILVFLSFLMFLLLNWELYSRFPKWEKINSIKLLIFRGLSIVFVIGLVFYLFYFYLQYVIFSLFYLTIPFTVWFSGKILPKVRSYVRQHKIKGNIVAWIIISFIMMGIFVVLLVTLAIILIYLGLAHF